MRVVTVKKSTVNPTIPNVSPDETTTQDVKATTTSATKTSGRPRTTTTAYYQKPLFISIRDVQKFYLPMLSLKRIRKIVNLNVHTIKVGNKIMVNREQLETLLRNPETKNL